MNTTKLLRAGLGSMLLALLLSCGGGGDYSGTGSGSITTDGSTVVVDGGGAPGSGSGSGSGVDGGGGSVGGSGSSPGDGTSTAGNGTGDGSGVGSGGTGVSTADAATSVGGVDGMGSIIVGGLRYDIDKATIDLKEASQLQIGMTVAVTGPVDAAFTSGVATKVVSVPQLRGPVTSVDVAGGSFELQGVDVSVDEGTVWGDLPGLASLPVNSTVQVWGLPSGPGMLRATRVETRSAGDAPLAGEWYAIPTQAGVQVQLEGVITDYASQGAFKLLGQSIDASAAAVTGGQPDRLGDGIKVVASGTLNASGVLVASKLKIRHLPGGGALPAFTLIGAVSEYVSPADFRVRGQRVDASGVTITGIGQLANGVRVNVQGTQVVNGVLLLTQLSFE
ncbi:DUF5666 domain-containing protein [Variovorax sp. LARHSF232]